MSIIIFFSFILLKNKILENDIDKVDNIDKNVNQMVKGKIILSFV